MTPQDVRRIALALPEVVESAHMGHPDFRAAGKIFATLWPEDRKVVLKLHRDQQSHLVRSEPAWFAVVPGNWGRQGATELRLAGASETLLRSALTMAWRNVAPKRALVRQRSVV